MAFTSLDKEYGLGATVTESNGYYTYSEKIIKLRNQCYSGGIYNQSFNGFSYKHCTWWVNGRANWTGLNSGRNFSGNAAQWPVSDTNTSKFNAGDVLVYSDGGLGHVAFIESVWIDHLVISEAANSANHPNFLAVVSVPLSVIKSGHHWVWTSEKLVGINRASGQGNDIIGLDPNAADPGFDDEGYEGENPPEGWASYVTKSYEYTGIYECGSGQMGDQSGTQDEPLAPSYLSNGTSRLNQRWEPFNMYTDERTLTYDENGKPVWSQWTTVYSGSDNFMLGEQPSYGNGWEIDWSD